MSGGVCVCVWRAMDCVFMWSGEGVYVCGGGGESVETCGEELPSVGLSLVCLETGRGSVCF